MGVRNSSCFLLYSNVLLYKLTKYVLLSHFALMKCYDTSQINCNCLWRRILGRRLFVKDV